MDVCQSVHSHFQPSLFLYAKMIELSYMSSRIIGSIDPNFWNVCSIGIPIQNVYDQVKYFQVWSYMPLEILKCQRHTTYMYTYIYLWVYITTNMKMNVA